MVVPSDLRYSQDHQWVRSTGHLLRVGLTHFAQEVLGEVAMVRLRETGSSVSGGDEMGEVEAFKAMSDLYMPVTGVIVAHNPLVVKEPNLLNEDPYGDGWLCDIEPAQAGDLSGLLDSGAYQLLIGQSQDV